MEPSTKIQILCSFFAVFWAFQIHSLNRYRLFNLHYAYIEGKFFGKQIKRWVAGIVINILAIILLTFLIIILEGFNNEILFTVASGISSLSVFGLTRLLHAFTLTELFYHRFYDDWEYLQILSFLKIENRDGKENCVWSHLGQSILYLLWFPLIGYLTASLFQYFF